MKKTVLLLASVLSCMFAYAQSEEINGVVIDSVSGESVPGAIVMVYNGNTLITGTATDFAGLYSIKPIEPGEYRVLVVHQSYDTIEMTKVKVRQDAIVTLDFKAVENAQLMKEHPVYGYRNPMVDKGIVSTGGYIDAQTLKDMPVATVSQALAVMPAIYVQDDNSDLQVKGSREGTTAFYLDGVKMDGPINVPINGVQDIKVITGGIPAKYGDVSGGVVLITTKSYYSVAK